MKIALDIEEGDIERIVRSLDNHHAYTRSWNLEDSGYKRLRRKPTRPACQALRDATAQASIPFPELHTISGMRKQAILLTAALFLLAGVGRADWQQVEAIQAGAPIMVRSGFVTNAGKFVRASADALTVQTQTGQVTVQKADVDEVYVFRSHAERVHRGLLFGGVAAGVTAAAIFPLTSTFVYPNYVFPSVMTASDGVSFGLIGSLNRFKRIYRHD